MRILYGVAGEGFGHSSRAIVLGEYLKSKGHIIKIITYGQAQKILKKEFDIFKVKGLHLIFQKGILKKRKTIEFNINHFSKNFKNPKKFHKLIKEFKPDLCISDMEPIVPILAYWNKIPLISFDNQHRLTNLKINVPKKYSKDYFLAKTVTNTFVKRAKYFVITSFIKSKIKKKNTFIISPIIRKEIFNSKSKEGKKILVYLTKKNKNILSVLKQINEKFIVYGYDTNKKTNNLEFKKKEFFKNDLINCKAIIATSGFTLISEALYLKKPYLALPLKGQFEQVLNALFLKQAKFGDYSEELSVTIVNNFLKKLEIYTTNLKKYNPDFDELPKVFDKILKNIN